MKAKKQETAATMKDVALKAKVSTATVSRALMNPDKVSQATRNRVEKAAREVGYLPQPMGRNVKRNESRTILVIVPDICDPFFSEIIRGIEVTAANHGYLVLIGDCAHQNQQEKTFIDLIITKQIDGMLLLGSRLPFDASIEEQRNLPPMVMANEFAALWLIRNTSPVATSPSKPEAKRCSSCLIFHNRLLLSSAIAM